MLSAISNQAVVIELSRRESVNQIRLRYRSNIESADRGLLSAGPFSNIYSQIDTMVKADFGADTQVSELQARSGSRKVALLRVCDYANFLDDVGHNKQNACCSIYEEFYQKELV